MNRSPDPSPPGPPHPNPAVPSSAQLKVRACSRGTGIARWVVPHAPGSPRAPLRRVVVRKHGVAEEKDDDNLSRPGVSVRQGTEKYIERATEERFQVRETGHFSSADTLAPRLLQHPAEVRRESSPAGCRHQALENSASPVTTQMIHGTCEEVN